MVTLNATTSQNNSLLIDDGAENSFSIQQTSDITGTNGPDILFGTSGDDSISALGGNDTIIGTTGADFIDGGDGLDTADYTDFGEAVTILPAGAFDNGADSQLFQIERIIGATGQQNIIDGSSVEDNSTSINVDLGNNSLTVENIPTIGSISLEVENFVRVIGTNNPDIIVGNNANNNLRGGAGDDEIVGGGGNDFLIGSGGSDRLNGTDSLLRGANERDGLVGGGQSDRFIVGDETGSFYIAAGDSDFTEIRDFSSGDIIELGRNETYSVERTGSGFNLFSEQGEGQELVAKVQFSSFNSSFVSSRSISEISTDSSSSFDNQIELPNDSFQLDSGESLDIFTVA